MTDELIASCCDATIAHVQRQRRDATCPTCGVQYVADLDATIPRVPAPLIDARVHVADELALRPSRRVPEARLTHVEDAELVRVRRLLTELRPDRGGPLGWAADGAPPAPSGSNWTPTLRIDRTPEVPAILPGAFASTSPASRAPDFDRGFPGMPDDIRATLRWCQRSGTLAKGLRAFYETCALAVASAEVRAKWDTLPPIAVIPAQQLYGRKRVGAALAAWWGEEGLDAGSDRISNSETRPPVAAVEVRPAGADAGATPPA